VSCFFLTVYMHMQQVVGSDDRKDCCCRRITTMRRTAAVNYSRVRALPPGSASRRRSWSVRVGLRTLLGVGRCPIASYVWLGDALWRHGKNLVVTVMVALRITSNIPTAGMPRHAKHVPPKVPIPMGSGPHLIRGFLSYTSPNTKWKSRLVELFCRTLVTNRHTQTDLATPSVAISRI